MIQAYVEQSSWRRAKSASEAQEAIIDEDRQKLESLTECQLDALRMLCKGYTAKEAAKMLGIATCTFKDRQTALLKKLGVNKMIEAAVIAGRLGIA